MKTETEIKETIRKLKERGLLTVDVAGADRLARIQTLEWVLKNTEKICPDFKVGKPCIFEVAGDFYCGEKACTLVKVVREMNWVRKSAMI